jgi:hypothetical protein
LATAPILDNTLPGCHRLWSVFRRLNLGGSIEAAPEIPGRDGAVGVPGLGDPREVSRLGMNLEAVGLAHGIANAQIQDRQHIGALERENQEHLRRPDTHPFHLCQAFNDFFIGELEELAEVELTGYNALGEVPYIGSLLLREAAGAKLGWGERQQSPGRKSPPHGFGEAGENGGRRLPADLLVHNRPAQRFKIGLTRRELIRADLGDEATEDGVGFLEMCDGVLHSINVSATFSGNRAAVESVS